MNRGIVSMEPDFRAKQREKSPLEEIKALRGLEPVIQ